MDNREFDNNIRKRLEQMESQPPADDWDVFSEILSAEEGFETIDFDEAISKKLKKNKKPYNSNHWKLLKQRLETEARLKKEVVGSKILESVLVLLLVFTFFNLENYFKGEVNGLIVPIQYASTGFLQYPDFSFIVDQRNADKLAYEKAAIGLVNTVKRGAEIVQDALDFSIEPLGDELSLAFTPLNIIKLNNNLYQSYTEEQKVYDIGPHDSAYAEEPKNEREYLGEMKRLESDQNLNYEIKEAYPMFYIKPELKEERKTYLTVYANSDLSIINSPGDANFNLDSYRVFEEDFGVGMGVSSKLEHFEIAAALEIKRISYNPVKISEITGGFREPIIKRTLDKISFDVVTVPIKLKYHLFDQKRTHFWAGVGVAGNLALFSDYNIEDEVIAQALPSTPPEEGGRNGSYLDQKNYHEGAFSNGSFFDNLFVSGIVEMGLEYRATDNITFTGGLGYSKSISRKGLGPNEDIIDALRLGLGVKYQI